MSRYSKILNHHISQKDLKKYENWKSEERNLKLEYSNQSPSWITKYWKKKRKGKIK